MTCYALHFIMHYWAQIVRPNMGETTIHLTENTVHKPVLARAKEAFQGFVEQHINADDPYDRDVIQQISKDERTPFWMGVALVLMLLSGLISLTTIIMLLWE
jgi:hypothetical protein